MKHESFERMYFALCSDGTLTVLGDHGDYEAADFTAENLGLETVWLVCGDQALQWAAVINEKHGELNETENNLPS